MDWGSHIIGCVAALPVFSFIVFLFFVVVDFLVVREVQVACDFGVFLWIIGVSTVVDGFFGLRKIFRDCMSFACGGCCVFRGRTGAFFGDLGCAKVLRSCLCTLIETLPRLKEVVKFVLDLMGDCRNVGSLSYLLNSHWDGVTDGNTGDEHAWQLICSVRREVASLLLIAFSLQSWLQGYSGVCRCLLLLTLLLLRFMSCPPLLLYFTLGSVLGLVVLFN